ncbi:hypothetical protein PSTT_07727, partial [Puccinia striiformis]
QYSVSVKTEALLSHRFTTYKESAPYLPKLSQPSKAMSLPNSVSSSGRRSSPLHHHAPFPEASTSQSSSRRPPPRRIITTSSRFPSTLADTTLFDRNGTCGTAIRSKRKEYELFQHSPPSGTPDGSQHRNIEFVSPPSADSSVTVLAPLPPSAFDRTTGATRPLPPGPSDGSLPSKASIFIIFFSISILILSKSTPTPSTRAPSPFTGAFSPSPAPSPSIRARSRTTEALPPATRVAPSPSTRDPPPQIPATPSGKQSIAVRLSLPAIAPSSRKTQIRCGFLQSYRSPPVAFAISRPVQSIKRAAVYLGSIIFLLNPITALLNLTCTIPTPAVCSAISFTRVTQLFSRCITSICTYITSSCTGITLRHIITAASCLPSRNTTASNSITPAFSIIRIVVWPLIESHTRVTVPSTSIKNPSHPTQYPAPEIEGLISQGALAPVSTIRIRRSSSKRLDSKLHTQIGGGYLTRSKRKREAEIPAEPISRPLESTKPPPKGKAKAKTRRLENAKTEELPPEPSTSRSKETARSRSYAQPKATHSSRGNAGTEEDVSAEPAWVRRKVGRPPSKGKGKDASQKKEKISPGLGHKPSKSLVTVSQNSSTTGSGSGSQKDKVPLTTSRYLTRSKRKGDSEEVLVEAAKSPLPKLKKKNAKTTTSAK